MKFYVQLLANTFFNWMKWTIFKENYHIIKNLKRPVTIKEIEKDIK